jgi:Uma2 family endonuclease
MEAILTWLDNTHWTEQAYFALPDSNQIIELANGKLIIHEMPTLAHQRAVRNLAYRLHGWNQRTGAGEVLFAAYPVRLAPGTVREPDVLFYFTEHRDRLGEQYGGPPDLAVEVLSPSTRQTDLREKLAEYAHAGVTEYWVVDAEARWIEVYSLDGERYRRVGRYASGQEVVSLLLPGFAVAVADLFGPDPEAAPAGPELPPADA